MSLAQDANSTKSQQIAQIKGFIEAEAQDKAREILKKGEQEFERIFQELKRNAEQRIEDEYKQKRDDWRIQCQIASSKKKKAAQATLISLRSNLVDNIKQQVILKIRNIEKHPQYPALLTNLIVQGLIRLQEEKVVIRCRKVDEQLVRGVLSNAEQIFKKTVNQATGGFTPTLAPLVIDTTTYLPPGYVDDETEYCSGGVEIVAKSGRIICKNTLDARLDIAFKQLLPHIRALLFGEKAKSYAEGISLEMKTLGGH